MLWCEHPGEMHSTGFLQGQYIGDNIQQLLETIEHDETSNKPGLVFIAYSEKALVKLLLYTMG
jgi:hypothetical protein